MDLVLQAVQHLLPKPKKEQRQKSSSFKGVFMDSKTGKFRAQICINGRVKSLGYHDQEIQAAKAYDSAAIHVGIHPSKLNFDYRKTEKKAIPKNENVDMFGKSE